MCYLKCISWYHHPILLLSFKNTHIIYEEYCISWRKRLTAALEIQKRPLKNLVPLSIFQDTSAGQKVKEDFFVLSCWMHMWEMKVDFRPLAQFVFLTFFFPFSGSLRSHIVSCCCFCFCLCNTICPCSPWDVVEGNGRNLTLSP